MIVNTLTNNKRDLIVKCYHKISSDVLQAYRSSFGVVEQVRSYYVDWRMVRDVKRRQMALMF